MTILDEELQRLNEKIRRMGCLVEEAIGNSIHALTDRNNVLARKVINDEHLIDARKSLEEQTHAANQRLDEMQEGVENDHAKLTKLAEALSKNGVEGLIAIPEPKALIPAISG